MKNLNKLFALVLITASVFAQIPEIGDLRDGGIVYYVDDGEYRVIELQDRGGPVNYQDVQNQINNLNDVDVEYRWSLPTDEELQDIDLARGHLIENDEFVDFIPQHDYWSKKSFSAVGFIHAPMHRTIRFAVEPANQCIPNVNFDTDLCLFRLISCDQVIRDDETAAGSEIQIEISEEHKEEEPMSMSYEEACYHNSGWFYDQLLSEELKACICNDHEQNLTGYYRDCIQTITGDPFSHHVRIPISTGCIDESAVNFNAQATIDDGSCHYYRNFVPKDDLRILEEQIFGCLDPFACNYNIQVTVEDGSCIYPTYSTIEKIACDTFEWNGTTYDTSGRYTWSTTNAVGCDSSVTLNLTINYASSECDVCEHGVFVDQGTILDCNGNCAPESWLSDGSCDDGSYESGGHPIYFNCEALDQDAGDCCPPGEIFDCDGNCTPEAWLDDGYCDDASYEYQGILINLNCAAHHYDAGDCEGGFSGSTPIHITTCSDGEILDCDGSGDCYPESWIADGYCDGADQSYGADLSCYDNDGGDCGGSGWRIASPVQKEDVSNISIGLSTYFDSRTSLLTLEIEGKSYSGPLYYQLYDLLGNVLDDNKLTGIRTSIYMVNLQDAVYVLKVNTTEKELVKTFKIVKY